MTADVDAYLGHRPDREGVDVTGGVRTGAGDTETIIQCGTQNALGEVRATTVPRAKNENGGWKKRVRMGHHLFG